MAFLFLAAARGETIHEVMSLSGARGVEINESSTSNQRIPVSTRLARLRVRPRTLLGHTHHLLYWRERELSIASDNESEATPLHSYLV